MLATAWQVTIINTFVAVLAGIMIFPAVFSFDYPIGRRPTGIHHFAQRIRAVTVQQLVVAYFLYLAGDGGTDFYHFLA